MIDAVPEDEAFHATTACAELAVTFVIVGTPGSAETWLKMYAPLAASLVITVVPISEPA